MMSESTQTPEIPSDLEQIAPRAKEALTEAEIRARRSMIIALVVVGLVVIGLIVLLVVLSINAYTATMEGVGPDPGAVVVSLLRDAAIIMVAFQTLVIGILIMVLAIQVQALVALLRDEIRPMLEALNETLATVRGTTQFVSHNVVQPSIQAASFLAGVQRVIREVVDLVRGPRQ